MDKWWEVTVTLDGVEIFRGITEDLADCATPGLTLSAVDEYEILWRQVSPR